MIPYTLYQNQNANISSGGKWYARAVHQHMGFKELCRHVASHSMLLDESTIKAVMTALEDEVGQLLLDGYSVQMGELGTLSLTIGSQGAESAADFRADRDINALRLNILPGGKLRTSRLLKKAKFHKLKNEN